MDFLSFNLVVYLKAKLRKDIDFFIHRAKSASIPKHVAKSTRIRKHEAKYERKDWEAKFSYNAFPHFIIIHLRDVKRASQSLHFASLHFALTNPFLRISHFTIFYKVINSLFFYKVLFLTFKPDKIKHEIQLFSKL
jgi:hypothetical protein